MKPSGCTTLSTSHYSQLIILICLAYLPQHALCTNFIFCGTACAQADNNWSNEDNWSPYYPESFITSSDNVLIMGACIVDIDVDCYGAINFSASHNGNSLSISSGSTFSSFSSTEIEIVGQGISLLEIDGSFQNFGGTITTAGNLTTQFPRIVNRSMFYSNGGSIDVVYEFINESGGDFTHDSGTLTIASTASFVNLGMVASMATIQNEGTVTNGNASGDIAYFSSGTFVNMNSVSNHAGSTWDCMGMMNNSGLFENTAAYFSVIFGSLTNSTNGVFKGGRISSDGIISNSGSMMDIEDFINLATVINASGGTINLVSEPSNPTTFDNGFTATLTNDGMINGSSSSGTSFLNWGLLEGSGSISTNTITSSFGSKLEPGSSPGTINLTPGSGQTVSLGGTYRAEIDGADEMADLIAVEGDLDFSSLSISVVWLTPPTAGSSFEIITYSSRSGGDPTITIPEVDGLTFTVDYTTSNAVTISASSTLPVELHSFRGQADHGSNLLEWSTAYEFSNYGFHVQRSNSTSEEWRSIGFVRGKSQRSGNSYSFIDADPEIGSNLYRLQQVDFDGTLHISPIIEVKFQAAMKAKLLANPPNSDRTLVQIPPSEVAQIDIYSVSGVLLWQFGELREVKQNRIVVLPVDQLPSGQYLVRINLDGRIQTEVLLLS